MCKRLSCHFPPSLPPVLPPSLPPGTSTTSSAMRIYSALARMSSGVAMTTKEMARSS